MTTTSTVNVYDFDHTIYRGDASFDFIWYCLVRRPRLWKYLPQQALALGHYIFGSWSRDRVKQQAFMFLQDIPDADAVLESFWDRHQSKVADWYRAGQQPTDIVISASPEFLLQPIARKLGIGTVIGTQMDPATGIITGENCRGAEKLRRLRQHDASITIGDCYSDHLSDMPLFELAQRPYVVTRRAVVPLHEYKPSKLQGLRDPAFIRFLFVGGINSFFGILFSYIIQLLIASPLLAFALGYSSSLVISYFLNAAVTFKETTYSVKQFWRFCMSYIPNFVIIFSIVYVLVDLLELYSLLGYTLAAVIAAPVTFLLLSKFTFTRRATR